MQPFNSPVTDRKRQKFGVYQSRYKIDPSMNAFNAPISSYRRELYGEVTPRYETESSMQPFDAPVSSYKRDLFGDYKPRYEQQSSMRPFDAPISDWKREMFGTYQKRYETEPSMKPFDAPISDWKRELYGDYQKRYETEPSMSAFDAPISDYKRELYGEHISRYEKTKFGIPAGGYNTWADGLNWETIGIAYTTSPSVPMIPTLYDQILYQVYFRKNGTWAGNGLYRILIDGVHAYPFDTEEIIAQNTWVKLGTLSTTIHAGQKAEIQFRSDNAGDVGPGQTCQCWIRFAELRPVAAMEG